MDATRPITSYVNHKFNNSSQKDFMKDYKEESLPINKIGGDSSTNITSGTQGVRYNVQKISEMIA